jgi:hypothetical protein
MIDEGDCKAIGGMKIGRENRSTRRKPAPAPLLMLSLKVEEKWLKSKLTTFSGEQPPLSQLSNLLMFTSKLDL